VLVDLSTKGLEKEPPVQESIAAGVDVVTFSGDKLLGGSQAGIIVGRKIYLDRIKCHPLARAVRVGKLTLAALEATLRLYLNPKRVWEQVPTLRALSQDPKEIKRRAQKLAEAINQYSSSLSAEVKPDTSEVGGGSLPLTRLPTYVVAVTAAGVPAQNLTANLRQGKPPVVARIAAEQVLLDLRTVAPSEEKQLVATVAAAAQRR